MRPRSRKQKRNTRKQKRNTRKQKGGVDVAVYEHANPDPDSMIAPYKGMRWTYGPYMNKYGDPKEGWYISKQEELRALQAQAEMDAHNDSLPPSNTEMDQFMAMYN